MERKSMTDEDFNAAVKQIQDEIEYYKSLGNGVCVMDGFSASVYYDRKSKQYEYMQMCPPLIMLPVTITKEQAKILKRELKRLDKEKYK